MGERNQTLCLSTDGIHIKMDSLVSCVPSVLKFLLLVSVWIRLENELVLGAAQMTV